MVDRVSIGSEHLHAAVEWKKVVFVTALSGAVLLYALSHVIFLAVPRNTFGAAGLLWLTGMVLVITAAALCPGGEHDSSETGGIPNWSWWEAAVVAFITAMAVVLRHWNLRDVPFNIYPDEVMTGSWQSGPTSAVQRRHLLCSARCGAT